jgi:hypothetical protein
MEHAATALQWVCGGLIPAMLYAWWTEPDRIKPVAIGIISVVVVLLACAFSVNAGYTNGKLAQFSADSDIARANYKTTSAEVDKIIDTVINQKDVTGKFIGEISTLARPSQINLRIVEDTVVPDLIVYLLFALFAVCWLVLTIDAPEKTRLNTNKSNPEPEDKRDDG